MQITYHPKYDLLYIRFDSREQQLTCERISEDIAFDIGEGDKIVGIEILDASQHIKLNELLPVNSQVLQVA